MDLLQEELRDKFKLECSNEEKNGGRKSRWNVPINRVLNSHMTPRSIWYCWETDSAQSDNQKIRTTKIKNSLTLLVSGQAGLNDEKKLEVENLVELSL